MKSDRVRDHLSRTERELYGILQRKYELIRGPGVRTTGSSSFSVPEKRPSWDAGKMLMRTNTPTGPYGSTEELAAHQLVSDFSTFLFLIIQILCDIKQNATTKSLSYLKSYMHSLLYLCRIVFPKKVDIDAC